MPEQYGCGWRRARLFDLNLYPAPEVDALDAAVARGTLAAAVAHDEGGVPRPVERVPQVGERFLGDGQLLARSGEPFFSLHYPAP